MKKILITLFLCIVISFSLSGCTLLAIGLLLPAEEETTLNEETTSIKEVQTTIQEEVTTVIEETTTEKTTEPLTEEEKYKSKCQEYFYDDIFFGDADLKGSYVKLDLMLSQKAYFTAEAIYSDTFREFDERYNLNRNLFKCCVLHKGETSYVGQQISMWFSNDEELRPENYETGQKVIVYGRVVSWSNNTKNGYNSVTIIPKYIEVKE